MQDQSLTVYSGSLGTYWLVYILISGDSSDPSDVISFNGETVIAVDQTVGERLHEFL